MSINEQFVPAELVESCPLLDQLLAYEFEVTLPEKIWQAESSFILVNIKQKYDGSLMNLGDDSAIQNKCSLALESRLALDGMTIQPGEKVIEPFVGAPAQTFLFTISAPADKAAKGELWISIDVFNPSDGSENRLPLFVVPVSIEVLSILGFPPDLIRYACLLFLLAYLVVWFRKRIQREG